MATRDYLRSAISEYLAPEMSDRGFVRVQPKSFIRIRGDLVDCLGFQLSQWGSKSFYVHSWITPKCAPPSQGYLVGTRHDYDGLGAVDWIGDTEERANLALASVRHYYLDRIEPWFQSMPALPEYVAAYLRVHKRRRESAEYLSMMLVLGRHAEYDELVREIDERSEPQSEELTELRAARAAGTEMSVLDRWREQNTQAALPKSERKRNAT